MYDAIIYIFNQGLQDYVTPLQDLTTELRQAIDSGKQLTGAYLRSNFLMSHSQWC